jgi:uncharacterized protein (DUF983 family)
MVKDQSNSGGDLEQGAGQYTLPVAGLLIIGAAVMTVVMATKKVTELALWSIPVVMYWAGVALAIKPLEERKARIQRTQEKIVTKLEQLDPVAKAQVARQVAEAELGQG